MRSHTYDWWSLAGTQGLLFDYVNCLLPRYQCQIVTTVIVHFNNEWTDLQWPQKKTIHFKNLTLDRLPSSYEVRF